LEEGPWPVQRHGPGAMGEQRSSGRLPGLSWMVGTLRGGALELARVWER